MVRFNLIPKGVLALALFLLLSGSFCEEPAPVVIVESSLVDCRDGADNDDDSLIDCSDPDCASWCGSDGDADGPEVDSDIDNDADPDGDVEFEGDADADFESDTEADAEVDSYILCETSDVCPPELMCYDFLGDGEKICAPRGASCLSPDDCEPGVTCGPVSGWPDHGDYCLITDTSCGDSSSCPDGFRCESGLCADRRFVCVNRDDCPTWDQCLPVRSGQRFCLPYSLQPCEIKDECSAGVCVDVEGDGDTECQESVFSTCETNADCTNMVCGNEDGERGTECGSVGPCLIDDDCPGEMNCVDVNDDGQFECQGSGGTCTLNSDCSDGQLCFDVEESGSPQCVESTS